MIHYHKPEAKKPKRLTIPLRETAPLPYSSIVGDVPTREGALDLTYRPSTEYHPADAWDGGLW